MTILSHGGYCSRTRPNLHGFSIFEGLGPLIFYCLLLTKNRFRPNGKE